jgi:hypothetical protein
MSARSAALVGLLALVAYLPSLANRFALDDVPAVEQDERIRSLANVPSLLTAPYLTYMPVARSPYRPLTTVSYALSWAAGRGHPVAFHATNVALHVAAALALLSLLGALGAGTLAAAAGAAVFATHPVHVEAVAGIVGRADVLATLFCLLALRLHLARSPSSTARVAGVALAYAAALGAKESAVVLPALIVLVDALGFPARQEDEGHARRDREGSEGPRREPDAEPPHGRSAASSPFRAMLSRLVSTWPTHVALMAVLVAYLMVRASVLGGVVHFDVASYIVVLPESVRVTTAIANLAEVARLLLLPLDLTAEYGPDVITPATAADARFWLGAATAAVALGVAARALRAGGPWRWVTLGVAWVAATFALLSNVVLPLPMWLGERTLYLPSVGVALAVASTLTALGDRVPPRGLRTAVIVVCALGAVHSALRSRVWRDDEALFGDLIERHPESFRAQWWLGGRMVDAGDLDGGLVWLGRAVERSPNSALLVLDYARALLLAGRSEEAEPLLRPIPPAVHPSRSVFLVQSLIFQDRTDEAAEVVREGLRFFPNDALLLEQARQLGVAAGAGG